MIIDVVKVFLPAAVSFFIGIASTPLLTNFLYSHRMWKKKAGKIDLEGKETPIFNKLHEHKEVGTPRMGGIVIWGSTILTFIFFNFLSTFLPTSIGDKLIFLSRDQTWLPLSMLILGSLIGLLDDWLEVNGKGGLRLIQRLAVVAVAALLCAVWFYFKLDVATIGIPFFPDFYLGILFIPFFVFVALAVYSGGVIDGIDGLAGGIFATIFAAYSGIAFYQSQINLAAFCAVMVGAILAFLWFNIPPARFYMSETGTMGLTLALTVVAFSTDTLGEGHGVFVLPIIALPLVLTSLSDIIQVLSKKLRGGKKVFLVAPLHHHFEALGWPSYKVTMRFWVFGIVFAILGMILGLIG